MSVLFQPILRSWLRDFSFQSNRFMDGSVPKHSICRNSILLTWWYFYYLGSTRQYGRFFKKLRLTRQINTGSYKIWQNNGWCYELETYTYPVDGSDTCNTFQICEGTNSMVGCEIFGDTCYDTCQTESEWTNWYAARIIPAQWCL